MRRSMPLSLPVPVPPLPVAELLAPDEDEDDLALLDADLADAEAELAAAAAADRRGRWAAGGMDGLFANLMVCECALCVGFGSYCRRAAPLHY